MEAPKEFKKIKVVRNWTNGFAQDCYELEDGAKLYISYNRDEVRIEK